MKTLFLEIDEAIYTQVINFLQLLPEKQCHIIETAEISKKNSLNITSAFGLVKTSLTATLSDMEEGIIKGAIDDSH